jgi:hypothetical protein
MLESNTVKIKDLPRAEEVLPGDLIIIEDELGSKSIDFRDFVVGPENTSFFNGLATNIANVSTYSLSLCSLIEENTNQTINAVRTNVANLTASVSRRFPRIFEYSDTQEFADTNIGTSFFVFAPTPDIKEADVTVNLIPPFTRTTPRSIGVTVFPPEDISLDGGSPFYQYYIALSAFPRMDSIGVGGGDSTNQSVSVRIIKFY